MPNQSCFWEANAICGGAYRGRKVPPIGKTVKSKYHSKPEVIDNIRFASKREGNRYRELKLLLRAWKITELELQPKFPIKFNDKLLFTYIADFSYYEDGRQVIEDAKGFRTAVYKLKKRIVEAVYGVSIREV